MRLTLAAIVAVLALLASACLDSSAKPRPKSNHHTTTGQTQVSLPPRTFHVSCVPIVTGGLSSDFLDPDVSVRAGAIIFDRVLANRGYPSEYKPVAPGRYNPTKTLVLLRKAHDALVEVPKSQQHVVSLLFDPSKLAPGQSAYVTDGAPAVLFRHCPTTTTSAWIEYPGSFIVAGARCGRLEVTPLKPGTLEPIGKAVKVKIPFGRRMCGKSS